MGVGEVDLSPSLGDTEGTPLKALSSSHCGLFQGLLFTFEHPRGFPV